MAHVLFDRQPDSTPYDLGGELTQWQLAGGPSYPAPTEGLHGPGRLFNGTAGYQAIDNGAVHMGLRGLTVRALVQIDADALAGTTATLLARGQGGPTAGEYWAWDVRVSVAADALSVTVSLAWQEVLGTLVVHDLGTFGRPAGNHDRECPEF